MYIHITYNTYNIYVKVLIEMRIKILKKSKNIYTFNILEKQEK